MEPVRRWDREPLKFAALHEVWRQNPIARLRVDQPDQDRDDVIRQALGSLLLEGTPEKPSSISVIFPTLGLR